MRRHCLFTDSDRRRLGGLLLSDNAQGLAPWHVRDKLEYLLEEADTIEPESISDDVVTMNSTVRLIKPHSAAKLTCTVVYPEDVDFVDDGISVLDPLGTLLIGCEVGDLVECNERKDRGPWQVAEIVYQPERVGKFEL